MLNFILGCISHPEKAESCYPESIDFSDLITEIELV